MRRVPSISGERTSCEVRVDRSNQMTRGEGYCSRAVVFGRILSLIQSIARQEIPDNVGPNTRPKTTATASDRINPTVHTAIARIVLV